MRLLYDVLMILAVIFLIPKFLWDHFIKKKKIPTFAERLGWKIPDPQGKEVIWIHAISVGEVKAAQTLFEYFKAEHPSAFFLITHMTVAGHLEAKRSLASADAFAFLPLDISWIQRRWAKCLSPTYFILMEGDFWFNQLQALKKQGTKLVLVSGKISEKSALRFSKISFFAKKLFGLFDLFCVQSEEFASRFAPFVKESFVTGNIKLDAKPQKILNSPLNGYLRKIITLASTHAPEENLLLDALKPFMHEYLILLAPRHPDRLEIIKKLLHQKQISFKCWSEIHQNNIESESLILVDFMGQLPLCYAKSEMAIVGGSFVDGVGGHNILEPCLYGCPSIFGPYTYGQKELTTHVLQAGAGRQIQIENLASLVEENLLSPKNSFTLMKQAATTLSSSRGNILEKTISLLKEKNIWK